jgi:hypothetical protein
MAVAICALSLLAAGLTLVDQLRRPASAWTAADRDRSYWATTTFIAGLFACGVLAAIAYAVGVLPRFDQMPSADHGFGKQQQQQQQRTHPSPEPEAVTSRRLAVDLDDL